jgi:hypothetical protein
LIHVRLKEELERLGIKPAAAAKAAGEADSQGLRDVLGGRKRLSADLLAALESVGVDVSYVLLGRRGAQGISPAAVRQAVLDTVDFLSLKGKVDAPLFAQMVVTRCTQAAQLPTQESAAVIKQKNIVATGTLAQAVGKIVNKGKKEEP